MNSICNYIKIVTLFNRLVTNLAAKIKVQKSSSTDNSAAQFGLYFPHLFVVIRDF